jgi:hypothetical protein
MITLLGQSWWWVCVCRQGGSTVRLVVGGGGAGGARAGLSLGGLSLHYALWLPVPFLRARYGRRRRYGVFWWCRIN